MKVLVSTFGGDDYEKVVRAMRMLPYARLVLIGYQGLADSEAFARIRTLEEMSGHEVTSEIVPECGFMELVDAVSEILQHHARNPDITERNDLVLNISGGDKLLGDAALLAAFRLGVEACHCDERLTKLPILRGATVRDRFTPSQLKFLNSISDHWAWFDDIAMSLSPGKRQPVERVMRELKKAGLLETRVVSGKVRVALSKSGAEVARAIKATDGNR